MALEEIRSERLKKLEAFRSEGGDPYPAKSRRTHAIADLAKKFGALAKSKKKVVLAGRVVARREHGGAAFFDLSDGTGKFQLLLKEDLLGEDFGRAAATIDIGDFVEVEGACFATKRGERTLEVRGWRMLAKSLLPLPEKWHGLQDVEERFRKRYLDLLVNEGVRERFLRRSALVHAIRSFFDTQGFLEVETPLLHSIPGGALARPFVTHHNALDTDFYLRIAPELYLKRLLIGGFDRVFEIGRCFRNEGIDATHNPEFTMLEAYAAYWDEEDMMGAVEDLFMLLGKEFGKKGALAVGEKQISFKKPFARIAFKDLLARYALIPHYDAETRDSLAVRARQFGIEAAPHESKEKIADEIYKKICRPYLTQPTFVVHHPIELSPLAKRRAEKQSEVRRFQLITGGLELANGFAELNDPIDQRARFQAQERDRQGGEEEAHRVDEDFLEALEYGMPPAAGLGIGIDRLLMLLTDMKNIREVVLFPTLRPK